MILKIGDVFEMKYIGKAFTTYFHAIGEIITDPEETRVKMRILRAFVVDQDQYTWRTTKDQLLNEYVSNHDSTKAIISTYLGTKDNLPEYFL